MTIGVVVVLVLPLVLEDLAAGAAPTGTIGVSEVDVLVELELEEFELDDEDVAEGF